MKNNLYCASTTLNLCPISIAKMCFVHFRYMYNCRRTCHATMGPQNSWSSIACFYYRILRFMPGPSAEWPKITLNDFKTVMDYSILFWIKSIFLTKQYVLDMDQKAKLYNKGYFWSSPKSFGFLHKFQLQLQKHFDHIAFDFIVQKKLHCLAVDQSMYKKRNMFQQYNDTYFLIRSRKNWLF